MPDPFDIGAEMVYTLEHGACWLSCRGEPIMTPLKCQCGEPVTAADVERVMLLLIGDTPAWYYCKYRCHHCDHVGQELIRPDDWEPNRLFIGGDQLPDPPPMVGQPTGSDKKSASRRTTRKRKRSTRRREEASPITTDEVIDFALSLETMTDRDWNVIAIAREGEA